MIPILPIRLRSLVWLWLALLALVLTPSLGLASIGKSGCKVVYDGQGFVGTGYDGCSLRAFDYDSATVLTVHKGTDSTGQAGALFDKAAEFLAAKTGTTLGDDLAAAATRAQNTVGPGRGAAYGTRVHTALEAEVRGLNQGLSSEISYLNGNVVPRGTPGSVRLDVVNGPLNAPVSIFDLKTGSATLTPARIQQIQSHIPGGANVPVFPVRP